MQDIFDTKNLNDIPAEMDLCVPKLVRKNRYHELFTGIFQLKPELTKLEIQVGIFRKFGEVFPKKKVHYAIAFLKQKGFIKRNANGTYSLTNPVQGWTYP